MRFITSVLTVASLLSAPLAAQKYWSSLDKRSCSAGGTLSARVTPRSLFNRHATLTLSVTHVKRSSATVVTFAIVSGLAKTAALPGRCILLSGGPLIFGTFVFTRGTTGVISLLLPRGVKGTAYFQAVTVHPGIVTSNTLKFRAR